MNVLISTRSSLKGFKFDSFPSKINVCWDPESNKILTVEILFSQVSVAMALAVCRIIDVLPSTKHDNFPLRYFHVHFLDSLHLHAEFDFVG